MFFNRVQSGTISKTTVLSKRVRAQKDGSKEGFKNGTLSKTTISILMEYLIIVFEIDCLPLYIYIYIYGNKVKMIANNIIKQADIDRQKIRNNDNNDTK